MTCSLVLAACRESGRPALARDDTPREAGRATAAPPAADSAALSYRSGRLALDRGDTTVALQRFDEAMRWPLAPAASQVMYWKAFILARRSDSEDLVVARNLLQLALQLAPRAQPTGDASMLLLRVQARLAQHGDTFALRALDVPRAQVARCGEAASERLAWAADPRLARLHRVARLDTLLAERVPCGAMLREQAILLLAPAEDARSLALLLGAVEHDPAISVRRAALRVLPSPAPDAAKPLLRRVLVQSRDVSLLESAATAWHSRLADWGDAPLVDFLARPDRNASAADYVRTLLERS